MKSIKKYIGLFILILSGFAILVNSCKKNDITSNTKITPEQERISAIKAIQDRYGNVSTTTVYPINKEIPGFYLNANGAETAIVKRHSGIQSTCMYNCNTAGDISDLDFSYSLSYVERFFYCGSTTGSEVTATWKVSAPYTLLQTNGSLPSKGKMQFKNSSGTVINTNSNIPLTIVNNGADPNCSTNTIYTVTYTWTGVGDVYFSNGNSLEVYLLVYNDCPIAYNVYVSGWQAAAVYTGTGTYSKPCSRVDKVWINPSTGATSSVCATAGGAYVTCPSYPSGFTPTTSQQVEYRKRNNNLSYNWTDQTSTVYNGYSVSYSTITPTVLSCCDVLKLQNMYQGQSTYGWLVRYRNVYSPGGCNVISGLNQTWPLGTYNTEYWPY